MTRSILQSERDLPLTVTLPAWRWRQIAYAVEAHAEQRDSDGYSEIGDVYREAAGALCAELDVSYHGDLPVHDPK